MNVGLQKGSETTNGAYGMRNSNFIGGYRKISSSMEITDVSFTHLIFSLCILIS